MDVAEKLNLIASSFEEAPFLDAFLSKVGSDYVEFEAGGGLKAKSRSLVNTGSYAVALTSIPSQGNLGRHKHDEAEWIIILGGRLSVKVNGSEPVLLKAKDYLHLLPGIPHAATAETDVELLAITIPAAKGWPK